MKYNVLDDFLPFDFSGVLSFEFGDLPSNELPSIYFGFRLPTVISDPHSEAFGLKVICDFLHLNSDLGDLLEGVSSSCNSKIEP